LQASNVDLNTALARSPRLVHAELDGDVTMMSVETGKYYALRAVGARIWGLLEAPTVVRDICDRLTTQYRVEPSRCEAEVLEFVQHMVEEGVAVVTNNSTTQ
jgi:hypothetical protein